METLSKNLLNLIIIRMPFMSIRKIILANPNVLHNNMQFWRILFFRMAKIPIGSWREACELFSRNNDWYIKCYQCGRYQTTSLWVPVKCAKCGGELRHQDTEHSRYIKKSLQ